MKKISKLKASAIFALLLIVAAVNRDEIPMKITMLETKQNLRQLLALQQQMLMSDKPKELSEDPYAQCFYADINEFFPNDITDPKPIFGCVFSDQMTMNASLLRAGLFVHTTMGLASDAQLFSSNLMSAVGGHDFAGEQLVAYKNNAKIDPNSIPDHKSFNEIEQAFDLQVITPLIQKHQDNFIFFAIINTKKYKENLTHELLHAQYYNVPQIRPILLQQWQKVTPEDQAIITKCLQDGGYDMQQQELLLREFYSYFLQYNASDYLQGIKVLAPMSQLANVYGPKIRGALKVEGIQVLVTE